MARSILTAAQLVEKVKAYRALGTKARAQAKRNPLGKALKATLLAQDDMVSGLNRMEMQEFAGAIQDEQTGIRRLRFAETHEHGHDIASARRMIRFARERISAAIEQAGVDEETAALEAPVQGFDASSLTVVGLVQARRLASVTMARSDLRAGQFSAAIAVAEAVDVELASRELGHLTFELVKESNRLGHIAHERNAGREVPQQLTDELKAARREINRVVGEDARHLIGQVTSMFSVDPAHDHLGTLTGEIASVEPARQEDNHVVATYTTGLKVVVPRSLVAMTA